MDTKNDNLIERKQFFIDSIAKFCDKCGTPYVLDDVNILQSSGASVIIHFSCHNCKSKHIATFISSMGMSNRMPINTDLDTDEIQKFAKREVVSLQNILDVYSQLKENPRITI